MKILITGCSGFVGSHVLEHLLINTDWNFICPCSWTHKGTPERILESTVYQANKDRVKVITHDLVKPFTDQTIKSFGEVDYIINIASESHVDRSIDEPESFVRNNTELMLTMLALARKLNVKKFLQFSTDEVYGVAPEGTDHEEWSRIVPSNPYSASKAAQEAIAISYWRTYNVPMIITNTMNIFGERQDGEKYVSQLIRKINNGEIVTVHGSADYIGSRKYLHARNMADAVMFIMKNVEPVLYDDGDHTLPERFNIVGDVELNNLEMAQAVAGVLGKELKYTMTDFHLNRPGHDRRYSLDGTKLATLGWKAPLSFEESLEKTIKWTLTNRQWL
jgi:dTDP-glucose 4,6-dehydratase